MSYMRRRRQRRRIAPWWLTATAAAIGVGLVAPLVAVLLQALNAGSSTVRRVLSGPLLPTLLVHTVMLTSIVAGACGVIGLGSAWLVERTDLPFRRVFAVLLVAPLAVPEFVAGYSWVSLAPSIQGLWGAALVMTLALYPLVYLPVASSLRRSDPAIEEVARSLGVGAWRRFRQLTLPSVSRPLVGGMLLVGMYMLGEYGAFKILRYRTFATAIYTQYESLDQNTASALTLVLCLIGVVLLVGQSRVGGSDHAAGRQSGRPAPRGRLGRRAPLAVVAMVGLAGLAIGVPVGSIIYWMARGSSTTLPPASVAGTMLQSLALGGVAAVAATALALPVALMSVRHSGRLASTVERAAFLDRALPGIAIGLTLVTVAVTRFRWLYQTRAMLEVAYVILFFPLALVAVRAAVARVPVSLDDAARSLGATPGRVLRRITVPLVLPGLAAAATLVWLSATTELTATLLLRPTGLETLATRFWVYTKGLAYGAAAPYAAIMIVTSLVPVLLLIRAARPAAISEHRPANQPTLTAAIALPPR
jgi:iron(III) transport system permease protein